MSKKVYSTDVLGETHLPADLMTSTEGLNWGLDGYPDLAYGAGVLNTEVLGDSKNPPNLPDGVVRANNEAEASFFSTGDVDYSEMLKEGALTDLSWLDLAEQDESRLPVNPVDLSVPELEEAWGQRRRTDGIDLVPGRDLEEAAYEDSLKQDRRASSFTKAALIEAVRGASRRVTAGESFKKVAVETAQRLGHDAHRIRKAMMQIRDDAGLIGRVFVRASNYPGCASGKWSESVRKQAAESRYVVAKKECQGCVQAQNGHCAVFKKEIVFDVPWAKTVEDMTPRLEASGRKVASGEPKEALRKALAQAPRGMTFNAGERPVHITPDARVTSKEAQAALKAAPKPEVKVLPATSREARVAMFKRKVATVRASMEKGLRGRRLAAFIEASFEAGEIPSAMQVLGPLIHAKEAFSEAPTAAYSGLANDTRVVSASAGEAWARIRELQAPPPPLPKEVSTVVKWARQQMSEGFAGRDLTHLMENRFAKSVMKLAGDAVSEVRKAHEGLAGHVYVDAAAYASQAGTTGCEKAGSKHRANNIPTVLEMSRCATCTKRSIRKDGATMCQVYNKPLIKSAEEIIDGDPKSYAKEMVRLANGSDADRTAALFSASSYNHSEFRLGEDSEMDNMVLASDVEAGDLGEILFGGLYVDKE